MSVQKLHMIFTQASPLSIEEGGFSDTGLGRDKFESPERAEQIASIAEKLESIIAPINEYIESQGHDLRLKTEKVGEDNALRLTFNNERNDYVFDALHSGSTIVHIQTTEDPQKLHITRYHEGHWTDIGPAVSNDFLTEEEILETSVSHARIMYECRIGQRHAKVSIITNPQIFWTNEMD